MYVLALLYTIYKVYIIHIIKKTKFCTILGTIDGKQALES